VAGRHCSVSYSQRARSHFVTDLARAPMSPSTPATASARRAWHVSCCPRIQTRGGNRYGDPGRSRCRGK
jgi:hypothetical protein